MWVTIDKSKDDAKALQDPFLSEAHGMVVRFDFLRNVWTFTRVSRRQRETSVLCLEKTVQKMAADYGVPRLDSSNSR